MRKIVWIPESFIFPKKHYTKKKCIQFIKEMDFDAEDYKDLGNFHKVYVINKKEMKFERYRTESYPEGIKCRFGMFRIGPKKRKKY